MQKDNKNKGDTIKIVLNYIKRYRLSIVFSLIFAAITVVLTLYLPIITGDAVDYMVGKGSVNFDGLLSLIWKMAVIVVLTGISQWIMNVCNNRITY